MLIAVMFSAVVLDKNSPLAKSLSPTKKTWLEFANTTVPKAPVVAPLTISPLLKV